MKVIKKKEFDHYFDCYTELLEKEIKLAVLSKVEGKNACNNIWYEALVRSMNEWRDLAQDFRPIEFCHMWLRRELSYVDEIFQTLEKNYQGMTELTKVLKLHGQTLNAFIEYSVGSQLEEVRKGSSDYIFYEQMKQKAESILEKCKKAGVN